MLKHLLVTPDYKLTSTDIGVEITQSVTGKAACEVALSTPIQLHKKTIVANHVDADVAFATAVLKLRYEHLPFNERVALQIGKYDRTGKVENAQVLYTLKVIRGIHVLYANNPKQKYNKMVEVALRLLRNKKVPDAKVFIQAAHEFRKEVKNTPPEVHQLAPGIVFLMCKNFGALGFGYDICKAKIVIAYCPAFLNRYEKVTPKFTIAKRTPGIKLDLNLVLDRLNRLEPGWGGHETIIGSPLKGTTLSPDIVNQIVLEECYKSFTKNGVSKL